MIGFSPITEKVLLKDGSVLMALDVLLTLVNGGLIDTSSTRNALNGGTPLVDGFCQRKIIVVELSSVKLITARFLGAVGKPE